MGKRDGPGEENGACMEISDGGVEGKRGRVVMWAKGENGGIFLKKDGKNPVLLMMVEVVLQQIPPLGRGKTYLSCSRIFLRMILPLMVLGNSSTNSTMRGYL